MIILAFYKRLLIVATIILTGVEQEKENGNVLVCHSQLVPEFDLSELHSVSLYKMLLLLLGQSVVLLLIQLLQPVFLTGSFPFQQSF